MPLSDSAQYGKGAHFHEPQLDQDPMDRRLLVYYLQIIPEM